MIITINRRKISQVTGGNMETILIIIAGTLISMCFLFAFGLGFYLGMKHKENESKEELITVTNKNKRAINKYKKFAEFNG